MQDFTDEALAILRQRYPDFDFWAIKRVGVKGYTYGARRKGEALAYANADSPEALVTALRELAAQP